MTFMDAFAEAARRQCKKCEGKGWICVNVLNKNGDQCHRYDNCPDCKGKGEIEPSQNAARQ